MLKQIKTLVSSTASAAAADPAVAASTLYSQIAATEYRRQSMEQGLDALNESDALREEEEAEEMAKRSLVEATLLKEQEAGVAAVVAVAETQKKNLEEELDQAGATVEEKEVLI